MTRTVPCDPRRATKFVLLGIAAVFAFAATSGEYGFDLDANGRLTHNDVWFLMNYVVGKPAALCINLSPEGVRQFFRTAYWDLEDVLKLGASCWALLAFGVFQWAKRRCKRLGQTQATALP